MFINKSILDCNKRYTNILNLMILIMGFIVGIFHNTILAKKVERRGVEIYIYLDIGKKSSAFRKFMMQHNLKSNKRFTHGFITHQKSWTPDYVLLERSTKKAFPFKRD